MNFENIQLQDMSWNILFFLSCGIAFKAVEIADALQLKTKQVDAAITKSLVRYGFVERRAQLTRFLKKDYNLITITQKGKDYVEWKLKRDYAAAPKLEF